MVSFLCVNIVFANGLFTRRRLCLKETIFFIEGTESAAVAGSSKPLRGGFKIVIDPVLLIKSDKLQKLPIPDHSFFKKELKYDRFCQFGLGIAHEA